jgi:hypothetical protein
MSNDELEKFRAEFEAANNYNEEMRLRAKRFKMPKSPLDWLESAEIAYSKQLPKLPVGPNEEFTKLFHEQMALARHALATKDSETLDVAIMLLHENLITVRQNIRLDSEARSAAGADKGRKNREKTQRHKAWQVRAEQLRKERPSLNKSDIARVLEKETGAKFRTIYNNLSFRTR